MELKIKDVTYTISNHALYRMGRRGIEEEELKEALDNSYKRVKQAAKSDEGDRYLIGGKNKVQVIVTQENIIVTVYRFNPVHRKGINKQRRNNHRKEVRYSKGNRLKK